MAANPVARQVFVGVDSGGTRTNVTIEVSNGAGPSVGDCYEVEENLSGALKPELVPDTLRTILAPLEIVADEHGLDGLDVYVWISAAGFTPWTRTHYLGAMSDIAPGFLDGCIRSVGAANDGVSLLLGSRASGVVIAGTGSTVIVRSSDGKVHQAGGHEWVACDDGAGFWIGIRAIRQAYRDYESGTGSVLLQRFRQEYNVRARDDRAFIETLRELAIGHKDMKKEIARFAARVCQAAERGDKSAQNIVKGEAESLADVTAEALRRHFASAELSRGLSIVQCGSLLANEFYRKSFESQLEMRLRTDDRHAAQLTFERVATGAAAATQLAQDLAGSTDEMLELDSAFRPAIVVAD
ncbi:MAG TPA: BadF/BadG/BcrA/BcrD ATPase family protein [Actinomycetota bacterium]|nr:BadF/BadG/BcrA/BcrD ATPase family protein [Actinomycetota bacterium]